MDQALREHLRIVIAVALQIAKRSVKRAFADRTDDQHDAAVRQLSQSAADAVLQTHEVARKPDEFSRGGGMSKASDEQGR